MTCVHEKLMANSALLFAEMESWEKEELGELCPRKCTLITKSERLEAIDDSDIPEETSVFSPFIHSEVTAEQMERMPNLKFIATRSTGFNHIDLETCNDRGILVANVPNYGEDTVAEHAFGMLLALSRKIHRCYERTSKGDFSIEGLRGFDLAGKTFGCLGVGSIGARAMRIAGGFGMNRIAYDLKPDPLLSGRYGFRYVDFESLLAESDVLSVHLPLVKATEHMLNTETLGKMKPGAILINTARGGIVDTAALLKALKSNHLGGAGLDVLEAETVIGEEAELLSSNYDIDSLKQIIQSNALLKLPNVIITPHNAFNSIEACRRIIETTLENIHGWMLGEPQNIVNK